MAMITLTVSALLAILFGILILVFPKALNYFVAIWLILYGLLQMLGSYVGL